MAHDKPATPDIGRRRFITSTALGAGGLLAYPALSGTAARAAVTPRSGGAAGAAIRAAASGPYQPTVASLSEHPLPQWYRDAKFGIFIHWGVYSVPAWAPVGQEYAEWYWHNMDNKSDPTYQHELSLYGPNATYDQFIPQFTASNFDPKAWVDLFQRAGARYFVQVTKHHDGFALFNTAVSHRAAVYMGPARDLVKELFDAAEKYAPGLKRGTYYSLPEWYNPAYPGDGGSFPGGGPKQYVTGAPIPYTGYLPVSDYVNDFQVPQLMELINQYDPDILWGDIGGPNNSLPVIAYYYNHALSESKEVVVNNRMGVPVWDFTTPEYASNFQLTTAKWEATQGIDPFSFGYNSATPVSDYFTAEQLILRLVDIVSKNGNFLLDIGPEADGTVPQVMVDVLTEMGDWLRINGDAIYGSAYWVQPADGNLRFTVTPGKFNMISLGWPGAELVTSAPVPISAHAKIRLLGGDGSALPWTQQRGQLVVSMPPNGALSTTSHYAYTFTFDWNR
jgi:alpha-L-fucosidase